MVDRTIDEILEAVTVADSRIDSIIAFVAGLKTQLEEALANTRLTPAVQAQINSIFDMSAASAAKVDTALNTGVPEPVIVDPPVV